MDSRVSGNYTITSIGLVLLYKRTAEYNVERLQNGDRFKFKHAQLSILMDYYFIM